jgi:hypothetical protein
MARRGTDEAEVQAEATEGENGRKAPVKGEVNAVLQPVSELPTFPRASGYTRESQITQTMDNVKAEFPEGTVVLIREYEKRESANGTLYNLRKRHGKPGTPEWTGWTINVGPVEGKEGFAGLYVSYTDPANYVAS